MREPPINCLNNSYYAAEALKHVADAESEKASEGSH
jgi:hypothetical protein